MNEWKLMYCSCKKNLSHKMCMFTATRWFYAQSTSEGSYQGETNDCTAATCTHELNSDSLFMTHQSVEDRRSLHTTEAGRIRKAETIGS